MIICKVLDGESKTFDGVITAGEVIKDADCLSNKIKKNTVAVKVDGVVHDLSYTLESGETEQSIEPILVDSPEGLVVYRHTTAHVLAQAVKNLYGDKVKITIGPVIESGFYYDFDLDTPFTPEDLEKIEGEMQNVIKAQLDITREDITATEAIKLFKAMGEDYKEEIINDLGVDMVSIYRQGDFVDLCRGPHLPNTGKISSFKITSSAGAYWRGDENNKMLQRIYGTAFGDKRDLKAYLNQLEEAKKRDHRRLGKDLDLFSTSEDIGAGLILWHPKGARIRSLIEDFWKAEHFKAGYSIINTPHVAKVDLWKKSGHWDFYQESLYSPMDVDGQDYIVKPMNCPFHIEIYKNSLRSYRELPIRYAELGTVYRYERSGALHGLLRVRGFTQDDAHLYLTSSQLEGEIEKVLKFITFILGSFGFNEFDVYLSTRPEKSVGSDESWEQAEKALANALDAAGLEYVVDPGEGVFYGPKIDIKIKDSIGRSWQCSTVQVDFNLPDRFDLEFINEKGLPERPVMVHRALMGSLERFFGCLIEHYAGAFPMWLAPVQATILTITDRTNDYAEKVCEELNSKGFRVEVDKRNEKLGYKIREAQLSKVPYILVVGDKEMENNTVSPRSRKEGELPVMTIEDLAEKLNKEVIAKS